MIEPIYDECEECPNQRKSAGISSRCNKHRLTWCMANQGYPKPEWCPVKEEIDEYGPELGGDS